MLLPLTVRREGQVLQGGVLLAGKLDRRGVTSAVRPGRLFYVTDGSSNRRFLVDTGSAFSIMPWQSSLPPSGPSLTGADGRSIPCWGEKSFNVSIGGETREWTFLLAAVAFPILGADFLRHHNLLVDVANQKLLLKPTAAPVALVAAPQRSYADVVRRSPSPVDSSPPSRGPSSPSVGSSPPSRGSSSPSVGSSPPSRGSSPPSLASPSASVVPPSSSPVSPPPDGLGGWEEDFLSFY